MGKNTFLSFFVYCTGVAYTYVLRCVNKWPFGALPFVFWGSRCGALTARYP